MSKAYDEEAEAVGWLGPEVAFGMIYKEVKPGQSILDIGIGTGLAAELFHKAGLKVYGMDLSEEMLEASREKGVTVDLRRHDLTQAPYPYESESMDHAACVGVLHFFEDLAPVFEEAARILRAEGLVVFIVSDRDENEDAEFVVGPELTKTGASVTMYRHSAQQIGDWLRGNGFRLLRSHEFTVFMDRERKQSFPAKAYLARK